ncbi:MAG TPA: hypothetical protein VMS11_04630 [Solirubrobacterales bacterium]|nr:hypothetical protein [Solirubrobacterales bacterium]
MTAPADGSPTPFPAREPDQHRPPAAVPDPGLNPTDPPSPSSPYDASSQPTEVHPTLAATSSSDHCPSCGKPLAADQRYCLECGHRRGDPRLPFMDAVVFMEAINQPQTPPPPPTSSGGGKSKGMSANTSLIAGIATLVLAIGVGVLIGQSGDNGTSNAASQAPQIIRVGGGGEGEEEATPEESGKKNTGKKGGKEKKANNAAAKKAESKSETGSSGTSKAVEEVLEPKVPQAKPEATVGESCDKGTAGCSDNGKFEGNFFGE